ncbi:MAG: winged helix-turn-helix domain-containing protein [Candidatus Omnitrophica bacterium]|nr:winged helix-turn-helix domain-containing protein [Candidatus Omnitrophota bacterium]
MITKIGIVAGEIWNYLDNHGKEARANDIIENLDKERDVVLMSIGWLAREGHILVKGDEPDYKIHLT